MRVHQIRVDFAVTEQVKRYVFVYLIEAKSCYLIDSGVYGSEEQIKQYMKKIGRDISEVKAIFLTHAHPDHIGTAAWFREHIGCKIYASQGERAWIENIDQQYQERPIPNFYKLAGKSTEVDVTVRNGDLIPLEEINDAEHIICTLDEQVQTILEIDKATDITIITNLICERLKMPYLKENPLFRKTIWAHCLNHGDF